MNWPLQAHSRVNSYLWLATMVLHFLKMFVLFSFTSFILIYGFCCCCRCRLFFCHNQQCSQLRGPMVFRGKHGMPWIKHGQPHAKQALHPLYTANWHRQLHCFLFFPPLGVGIQARSYAFIRLYQWITFLGFFFFFKSLYCFKRTSRKKKANYSSLITQDLSSKKVETCF